MNAGGRAYASAGAGGTEALVRAYIAGWMRDAAIQREQRARQVREWHREAMACAAACRDDPTLWTLAMREASRIRTDLRRAYLLARRYELAAREAAAGYSLPDAMDRAGLHNPFGRRLAPLAEAGTW